MKFKFNYQIKSLNLIPPEFISSTSEFLTGMLRKLDYDALLKAAGTSGRFQAYYIAYSGFCHLLSSLVIAGLPFLEREPQLECLSSNGAYTQCT